jgi:hypothetical protein
MRYSKFVAGWAKPLPTKIERLRHALLGVIGEVGEIADCWKKHIIYEQPLDTVNLIEELGDLRFYIQMVENEGYNIGDAGVEVALAVSDPTLWIMKLNSSAGTLSDLIEEGSEEEINAALIQLITSFLSFIVAIPALKDLQMTEICNINMAKLRKRYPNGYNNQHALQRMDKVNGD